jgi:hypothetical protein
MTIPAELRQAIERAGNEPVCIEDPQTRAAYVLLKADVYERMRAVMEAEEIDPSYFEIDDFEPARLAEVQRRSAEIDAGTVELAPWTVVRDRVRRRLGGGSNGYRWDGDAARVVAVVHSKRKPGSWSDRE